MNLEFDNRGGVCRMYAVPASSLLRVRLNYGNDITYTPEFDNREEIIEIPYYADHNYSFNEVESWSSFGESYSVEITGTIPSNLILSKNVEKLRRGNWLVLHKDRRGRIRMSGTADVPLRCEITTSSGTATTDLNGEAFKFQGVEAVPSLVCKYVNIESL